METLNLQQQPQQPPTSSSTSMPPTSSTANPNAKNIRNLSIKEFFTTRLMRARSFEGGANSPKDETTNWFDEFKARMTKKSAGHKLISTSNSNNNTVDENDDESNDSSCDQSTSTVRFSTSSSTKTKTSRQRKKGSDATHSLVKDNCDTYSNTLKDVTEDSDCGSGALHNYDINDDILRAPISDDTSTSIKLRKLRQVSCAESPDFDTASINTIFNRRDSRYEKIQRKSSVKLILVKALNLLRWIISYMLPFNYDLPWKFLSIVNCTFVIIVIGMTSKTNPDIMAFTFFNGFICGLAIAILCFFVLMLSIFVQVLPSSSSNSKGESVTGSANFSEKSEDLWFSKLSPSPKKVTSLSLGSEKKQTVDDFSSIEVLDEMDEAVGKGESLLDDDNYKAWMIEFIGEYELRNKSDIKLKLIFVRIENRILHLCKPKNSHEAESASFPVFVHQREYDLNASKKFSATLLLPKNVRNHQKYVWSKKYPIKLEFQIEETDQQASSKTSPIDSPVKTVQLTLFAKSCREKEEWFRRFKRIVEDQRMARRNNMHIAQKRASVQSDLSDTATDDGLFSSIKSYRSSPTPSAKPDHVQTSRSSNLLNNSRKVMDDEKSLDSLNLTSNISRTKSCEQLNANQSFGANIDENDRPEDDSSQFVEAFTDDSTLTKATAELFSQAMEFDNFLDSMPNLSYKDYIEKVIDSSQYASSTSDWFNALTGRIFFDVFSHDYWSSWFKRKIQRKLYRIRLPYFMETLTLTKIDLGTNAPQFLNVVSHSFDSFGLSIDFDMAYSGGLTMTFETKLNLLKIKSDNSSSNSGSTVNQQSSSTSTNQTGSSSCPSSASNSQHTEVPQTSASSASCSSTSTSTTKDSNMFNDPSYECFNNKETSTSKQQTCLSSSGSTRTSGESSDSDESDSSSSSNSSFEEADVDEISDWEDYGAEKTRQSIVRFVDKIASSRYFQHATENRYIKRKLQDISNCPLVLVVQIQSLNGVLTLNVPPPQTDRIWYGFKPNPELTLKALPKMGDREVNLTHVTDWIERKLAEEFKKILVIPNMEDIVLPVLKSDHLLYVTTTK